MKKFHFGTTLPIQLLLNLLYFLTDDSPGKTENQSLNQSVATKADITFIVEATGDDLQFQWQKDGEDIDSNDCRFSFNQTDYSTSSTLQIQCVGKSDKGHYKCLVKSPVKESGRESLHAAELQVCKFMPT